MKRLAAGVAALCLLGVLIALTHHNRVVEMVELVKRSPQADYNFSHGEVSNIFSRRVNQLNTWCSKRTQVDYTDYENAKLILHGYEWMYIPEFRLFYCSVAKIGSTTMKLTLMDAVGVVRNEQRQSHDQAADTISIAYQNPKTSAKNVPLVTHKNPFIKPEELAKHSLMIVRNPYERLVSAYMDKMVKRADDMEAYCKTYEPARTTYINSKVANITFSIFIDCVLSNRPLPFYNDHIYPMSRACGLCLIKYDMIVELERFHEEMDYVLSQLDGDTSRLREKLISMKKAHNRSTQKLKDSQNKIDIKSMYSQLSKEQITQIKLMYADDFEIFGYNPDVI